MSRNWSSIGQDKLHIVGQEQGDNFEPSDSLGIGKYLMSPRA